jgi:hypothetical protein
MRLLRGHSDRVTHMKYRPCGSIETSSLDGTMRIWTRAPTPSSSPSLCNLANGASSSTGVVTPLSPACAFPSVPCPPSPPPPPPLSSLFSPPRETENPYACSAVMKLFGSATDDNVGIASFSGACCELDRSNKHVESPVARSISPLRSQFSECSSGTLETSSGPNSTAGVSAVEGKDNNAPGTGTGAGVDAGAGVNLKGKSWLVAVSLGGFMKAFITPSFSYAPTSSPDPPSNLTSPDATKEVKRIHM